MWRLPWHNQVFCVIISFFATKLLPNFVDSWFFIFETFSITPERKTCLHEYKNEKISVDFRELTKERASPYFHQFHLVTKLMQIKPIWKGTELWEAEIVLKAMTTMETQFRTQNLETYWDLDTKKKRNPEQFGHKFWTRWQKSWAANLARTRWPRNQKHSP